MSSSLWFGYTEGTVIGITPNLFQNDENNDYYLYRVHLEDGHESHQIPKSCLSQGWSYTPSVYSSEDDNPSPPNPPTPNPPTDHTSTSEETSEEEKQQTEEHPTPTQSATQQEHTAPTKDTSAPIGAAAVFVSVPGAAETAPRFESAPTGAAKTSA
eukprot:15326045-Ditylum_brightwellii.AAC.1